MGLMVSWPSQALKKNSQTESYDSLPIADSQRKFPSVHFMIFTQNIHGRHCPQCSSLLCNVVSSSPFQRSLRFESNATWRQFREREVLRHSRMDLNYWHCLKSRHSRPTASRGY